MTQDQFESLLTLHGNEIFGFCCHLTGNRSQAEDLYQDSVLKAFELLGRINADSPKGLKLARNYVIGIAVKLNRNFLRKKSLSDSFFISGGELLIGNIMDTADVAADMEKKAVCEKMREVIRRLPEKLRNVVYMYYYLDMSTADISQQLEIPIGSVKSRLDRARKTIKKEMEELYHE